MNRGGILLIVILFFILPNKLSSQNFGGGMYGGIAASQISGDALAGFNKPGINVGIFTNYSFNESLKLQLELSFIQKGSRDNANPDNANPDKGDYKSYLLRLNYIEIPVLMNYKINKFFSFEAGPYVSYLLGFSEKDFNGEIPGSKDFNKYDLGISGGMHYTINENLDAVFRVSNSILPVRDHKGGGTYRLNRGQYNSVVSLGLHYVIRIINEQTY